MGGQGVGVGVDLEVTTLPLQCPLPGGRSHL